MFNKHILCLAVYSRTNTFIDLELHSFFSTPKKFLDIRAACQLQCVTSKYLRIELSLFQNALNWFGQ